MNYLIAILEFDEYDKSKFDVFYKDQELIEGGGDIFYGYMENPSDYSQIYFSTGPYSENCIVLYYKEIDEIGSDLIWCRDERTASTLRKLLPNKTMVVEIHSNPKNKILNKRFFLCKDISPARINIKDNA